MEGKLYLCVKLPLLKNPEKSTIWWKSSSSWQWHVCAWRMVNTHSVQCSGRLEQQESRVLHWGKICLHHSFELSVGPEEPFLTEAGSDPHTFAQHPRSWEGRSVMCSVREKTKENQSYWYIIRICWGPITFDLCLWSDIWSVPCNTSTMQLCGVFCLIFPVWQIPCQHPKFGLPSNLLSRPRWP